MTSAAPSTSLAALVSLLDAEAEVFRQLGGLTGEFRAALTDADVDRLNALGDRAETLATQFRMIESERSRVEQELGESGAPALEAARGRLLEALRGLLRQGAVSGTVLDRLADTAAARQAAVAGLFGASYLADGSSAPWRVRGASLSAEG